MNAAQAQKDLSKLIENIAVSHEPVHITSNKGGAVLVSEEDWKAIEETLYLLSVPGMRQSIRDGLAASIDDCSEELDW